MKRLSQEFVDLVVENCSSYLKWPPRWACQSSCCRTLEVLTKMSCRRLQQELKQFEPLCNVPSHRGPKAEQKKNGSEGRHDSGTTGPLSPKTHHRIACGAFRQRRDAVVWATSRRDT